MGVIVRTAGANKTKNEIEKDFQNTLKTWDEIKDKDVEKNTHNIDDLLIRIGKLEKAAESDAEEIDRLIMKLKKILETDND